MILAALSLLPLFLALAGPSSAQSPSSVMDGPAPANDRGRGQQKDVLLSSMKTELDREFKRLKNAEEVPLYYLGYEVHDTESYDASSVIGALQSESDRHYRLLDVDVRVGDRRFDNTHQVKGREAWTERSDQVQTDIPLEDDDASLRAALWLRTDRAFKEAVSRYTKVRTNKDVTAEEEDDSDDFSTEKPSVHYDRLSPPSFDKASWKERIKRLSLTFKSYPFIFDSNVALSLRTENRAIVNSDGTDVVTGNRFVRLSYRLGSRTEDGMDLERFQTYDSDRLEDMPDDETLRRDMARSIGELKALLKAPIVEPFTGPAIMKNRATAVYFHEVLGHRLEGHRQKMEDEGQTFTKMLGKPVVAPFISVYDDPTLERYGNRFLRGFYRFDDEGVPAQRVTLVEKGLLKTFLLSRAPIKGFPASNGHGRRSAGFETVARMGNTIVEASQTVSYDALKSKFLKEIKRQKKAYGLVFEDITGGFTATNRSSPQSFKVLPLLVYRVYADGRPDEIVRGVDIVGTPLTAFSKIIAAADDVDIFNGTCGAESGWVPVSGVAPSVLISEIEVEKKSKSGEKPPVLAPPFAASEKP